MVTIMKFVNYKEQRKDPKQAENWIPVEQIETVYDGLLMKVNSMLSKKKLWIPK